MPGPINAEDAVKRTRRYCGILDSGTYRDGFSTDASTNATLVPILFFENLAIRILCDTGIAQGDFTITTASGVNNYTYPSGMGKLIEMGYTVSGSSGLRVKPLREVTLTDLRARDRYYPYTHGDPNVYASIGPAFILYPVPDFARTLSLRGHKLAPDLVNKTDIPTDLPIWYHEAYPLFAAIVLLSSDDNPSRQGRVEPLSLLFSQMYPTLKDLVTRRSIILYSSRPEGDSLQRTMMEAQNNGGT